LGGGHPNPALFPFKKMTVELDNGDTIVLDGNHLNVALQYSPSVTIPSPHFIHTYSFPLLFSHHTKPPEASTLIPLVFE
jgi:hypothetical protein